MIVISRTPVRISFFGGGSDYPGYYLNPEKPGAVLGTTINQYTYVSLNTLSNFFDHKIRIGYSKTELVKSLDEIQHPSIRECLKYKHKAEFPNLDIHIFSDLPARTGLGSSSSFTVGFLNALYSLEGKRISKQRLAEEALFIEQCQIKENVGSQDQYHAAYGGFNIIEFNREGISVKPVVLSREKRTFLENHLLVFYTGLTRHASEVLKEQIEKTANTSNDQNLKKMVEMVYQAEDILLSCEGTQMVESFGNLLHKSWELKKSLSSQISNSFIDQAYEKAIAAGAYGGKLCGAGSGGFLALFVPIEKQPHVREILKELLEVSFRFEYEGSSIIYIKD